MQWRSILFVFCFEGWYPWLVQRLKLFEILRWVSISLLLMLLNLLFALNKHCSFLTSSFQKMQLSDGFFPKKQTNKTEWTKLSDPNRLPDSIKNWDSLIHIYSRNGNIPMSLPFSPGTQRSCTPQKYAQKKKGKVFTHLFTEHWHAGLQRNQKVWSKNWTFLLDLHL